MCNQLGVGGHSRVWWPRFRAMLCCGVAAAAETVMSALFEK
jgi:hypothetical protein